MKLTRKRIAKLTDLLREFERQATPLTMDELQCMRKAWTIDDAVAAGFDRNEILASAAALQKRLTGV